ncbi:cell division protein ZipA C-terminal FtsZ-binding domain-containing protein [Kaarinaea lacus]
MDDLRWILAVAGAVLVAAIYFSGRFEREEWRRDRDGYTGFSKPEKKPEKKPEIKSKQDEEKRPHSPPAREEPPVRKEPSITLPDESDTVLEGAAKDVVKQATEKTIAPPSATEKVEQSTSTPVSVRSARSDAPGINSEADVKRVMEAAQPEESIRLEKIEKPEKEDKPVKEQTVEEPVEEKKEDVSATIDIEEVTEVEVIEEEIEPGKDEWEDVVVSKNDRYIEDEIVDIEIPEELSELDSLKQEEDELEFKPGIDEPVQQELVLEVEPLILVLTVMAKGDALLEGKSIRRVLENSGLKCDDRGIYQFHMTGKKDAVFSVVSVIEPGVFDRDTIDEYETPGLTFICQLPGPLPNKDMFRIMQMKALNIADKLGAKLCDDRRNLLTEQATTHYNDRITEFDRELVLARKRQD